MDFYNRYNVDLNNLIHHSDRGVQYCSNLYVGMLKKHHINISMTQCGDPLHNALADTSDQTGTQTSSVRFPSAGETTP